MPINIRVSDFHEMSGGSRSSGVRGHSGYMAADDGNGHSSEVAGNFNIFKEVKSFNSSLDRSWKTLQTQLENTAAGSSGRSSLNSQRSSLNIQILQQDRIRFQGRTLSPDDLEELGNLIIDIDREIETLRQELNDMLAQLPGMEQAIAELESLLALLDTQLEETTRQLTELTGQLSAVNSQLSSVNSRIAAADGQLYLVNAQIGEADSQMLAVDQELASIDAQLASEEVQNDEARKNQLLTRKNELLNKKNDLLTVKNNLLSQKNSLETQRNELLTLKNNLETERNNLLNQLDMLEKHRADLNNKKQEHKEKLNNKKKERDDLKARISERQTGISELEDREAALSKYWIEAVRGITTYQASMDMIQDKISKINKIMERHIRIESLRKQAEKLPLDSAQRRSLENRIKDLENQLEESEPEKRVIIPTLL